ncbi:MAG: hypothetical protein JWQ76_2210, partial [Ramlibacter sp.]|nr:hypothetical protein [Ramlibacter sp.]
NIGTLDKLLRIFAGFVLVFLAGTGIIGPWGYIGVVPLVTAMLGYCPLYQVLGLSSCPRAAPGRT